MKRILILLMAGLTLACSKKTQEEVDFPLQQEGMVVTRNDQNKALLSITITSLKNITYNEVEVICARYSYKKRESILNYLRKMKKNEVISSEGKVVLDVTHLVDGIDGLWVTDENNRMYVLLREKKGERILADFNEVLVKIKKGETYHINLMGEKK